MEIEKWLHKRHLAISCRLKLKMRLEANFQTQICPIWTNCEVKQWNPITFWALRPSSSMPKCALRNIGHARSHRSSNVTNSSLRSSRKRKIVHFQHTVCAALVVNLWVEKCLWHFAKDFHYHFGDSPDQMFFKHSTSNTYLKIKKERLVQGVLVSIAQGY